MNINDYQSENEHQCQIIAYLWAIPTLLLALTFFSGVANATSLQEYIDDAMENNLALRQSQLSYQSSLAALREARGAFLPSLDISARYTRAGGGRSIEMPIGDLVNPVYLSLNELLGEQRFPDGIANQSTPLLREEEQQTKLTITQPLFQPAVYYNHRAKSHLSKAERATRDQFARELVAEVKSAFYNHVKAMQVVSLLDETEQLLRENLRVSESLFQNDKATRDVVYRAQAELSELHQQQAEAERTLDLARSYFNFLLNRPLDSPVTVELSATTVQKTPALSDATTSAMNSREEFSRLEFGSKAAGDAVNISKTGFLPGVVFAFDYGFEGEDYSFDRDSDFWTASFVLNWNIFSGGQDRARVQQAKLTQRTLQAQLAETRQQISMEVRNAHHAVLVAIKMIEAAEAQLQSARKSFEIVKRKYAEGMSPQIEYLDARTTLTRSEVNHINVTQDYQITLAEFERVTATYPINH